MNNQDIHINEIYNTARKLMPDRQTSTLNPQGFAKTLRQIQNLDPEQLTSIGITQPQISDIQTKFNTYARQIEQRYPTPLSERYDDQFPEHSARPEQPRPEPGT